MRGFIEQKAKQYEKDHSWWFIDLEIKVKEQKTKLN